MPLVQTQIPDAYLKKLTEFIPVHTQIYRERGRDELNLSSIMINSLKTKAI